MKLNKASAILVFSSSVGINRKYAYRLYSVPFYAQKPWVSAQNRKSWFQEPQFYGSWNHKKEGQHGI